MSGRRRKERENDMADDSKAAFPRLPVVRDDGELMEWSQTGMTLREWYAGAALRSALDHCYRTGRLSLAECASEAVLAADALLAALKES